MSEPTGDGDCFPVAFKIVNDSSDEDGYVLCHGMVTRHTDGHRHPHAWVEFIQRVELPDDRPPGFEHLQDMELATVIDRANGNDVTLPRALYYKLGQIKFEEVVRYYPVEARKHALRTKHYGPWHEPESS